MNPAARGPGELARGVRRVTRRHFLEWRGSDRIAGLTGRRVVSVIGDSHAVVFENIRDQHRVPRTWFDVLSVAGATALGLANPNSSTNALTLFSANLRRTPDSRPTIFMLGEIDCGFLVWHRSMTKGTSVESEFEHSLDRYTTYLGQVIADGRSDVTVLSVAPPTVPDYSVWAGLDNARRDITATLAERTDLTRAYNDALRDWAAGRCRFVDLDPDLIDSTTGLLRERYRNPDVLDHHLAPGPFADLLLDRLPELHPPAS